MLKLNTSTCVAMLCLLTVTALSLPAGAAELTWNTSGSGDFHDFMNWSPTYPPQASDTITISHGSAFAGSEIQIDQGGSILVDGTGQLQQTATGSDGRLMVGMNTTGTLTVGTQVSGDIAHIGHFNGASGSAVVNAGGTWTLGSHLIVGNQGEGSLRVKGTVESGNVYVGYANTGTNTVDVEGSLNLSGTLRIGGDVTSGSIGQGSVSMQGGSLSSWRIILGESSGSMGSLLVNDGSVTTDKLMAGARGQGFVSLSPGGSLTVGELLEFGPQGLLDADPGTVVTMANNASFRNTTQASMLLDGLANVHMTFGGSGDFGFYDLAGEDMGNVEDGWVENFAMGTLELLGTSATGEGLEGKLQLDGTWSNLGGQTEALYLDTLILGENSTLSLAGYNVYVRNFIDNGGTILDGGGSLVVTPEPTSLALLGMGALAMLRRRRRA